MADLTWTCHVCGRTRPDVLIAVRSFTFDNGDGMPVRANVRYCADSMACFLGTENVEFVVKLRELWGTAPSTVSRVDG